MASSQFWQERAPVFLQIPGHEMLRADGHYIIGSGEPWRWRFAGGATEFTRETFENLARSSAFEIAPTGTTDLLVAWLEAIRKEQINFHSNMTAEEVPDDGSKGLHYVLGTIDRVCEASAILCRRLANRALQTEFEEKQRNDPKNWSQLRQQFEAFKAIKKLTTGAHERIPVALVKRVIAEEQGIKPEEVTEKQIRLAVADLLRDYPAITLIPEPQTEQASAPSSPPGSVADEIQRRKTLLSDYKAATDNPSNKRIYEAKNSGVHKPEFYRWLNGTLPSSSAPAVNFERFLKDKKPPKSRN